MRYKYYYDMNSKYFESIAIYLNDFFKNESKERKKGYNKKKVPKILILILENLLRVQHNTSKVVEGST